MQSDVLFPKTALSLSHSPLKMVRIEDAHGHQARSYKALTQGRLPGHTTA